MLKLYKCDCVTSDDITFTFIHLTGVFIQSDLQMGCACKVASVNKRFLRSKFSVVYCSGYLFVVIYLILMWFLHLLKLFLLKYNKLFLRWKWNLELIQPCFTFRALFAMISKNLVTVKNPGTMMLKSPFNNIELHYSYICHYLNWGFFVLSQRPSLASQNLGVKVNPTEGLG